MALKIFTEAKPFLKAYMKPFDITEIRMLTSNSCFLTFCISYAINLGKAGETRLTCCSIRSMIGKKISHYKILEELGSGGMGVVYKAEDLKLKRTVALKFVVPRMLRKKEDKERFLREAQTAASLNHPHICTIYHIDEVEDSTFIVMEYVEGQSLKEIIRKGPLEPEKALDFAIQIAEGLEEAHEKNIVHRDIKSSNIMVTSKAQAKIMDFGLAKIVSESQLSETASIVGTVAYMSPEQACGDAIDHRSDIWSLGVVLYEMLSGHAPFQGEHEQLVLHSILNKYHEPITALRSNIPYELERILDKCLEKDPTERYQYANEFLLDLRRLKKETESGIIPRTKPIWQKRRVKKLKNIVVPCIFVFVAAVFISGYFLFDWFKPPAQWKASIAVLPIKDGGPLRENELLCMSTTRQIIFKLTKFSPELRVVPYDSVRNYKDSEKDSIEIGREFGVEYVLVASLVIDGKIIQINVELIDVNTNRNILVIPEKFGGDEIFDIEDEISKKIVNQLGLHFTESGMIAAKKREPKNIEAYNWYIRGMDAIDKMGTLDLEEWYTNVMRMFEKAISLDPNYALAYWGLGSAREAYYVVKKNKIDLELMLEHYEKAYELDPELAETNLALGWAYFYKEDLDKASASFKRALEIEPDSALVNCDVGVFLASIGLFSSAIKYYVRVSQVEPFYVRVYELSAPCNWYIGEFEEGIEQITKAIELEKNSPSIYFEHARNLVMLKEYEKAEQEMAKAVRIQPGSSEERNLQALLFARRGEKDKALRLIERAEKPYQYCITCAYSLLGMRDEAIQNIQLGIDIGFEEVQNYLYSYLLLEKNPCFDNLRDDSRFVRILKKRKDIFEQRIKKVRGLL
jgi:serine/threonine protein kinase/tetratricopeptide (TPR) repeat protein